MSITIPRNLKRTRPYDVGDTGAGRGMNNQLQPERLASGDVQDALNLFWNGGSWSVRPGISGQLTSAHASAVYLSRVRYQTSSGVAKVPYSTGGRLYSFTIGASAGVEITKPAAVSFAFTDSKNVRYATIGKYLYFLDSGDTSGSVWRVNLESTNVAEEVRGLSSPTITPLASLRVGSVLQSGFGALTWVGVTTSGNNLITSGEEDFPSGSTFWAYNAGATAANNLDADGVSSPCVEIDADGSTLDYVHFATAQSFTSNSQKLLFISARYAATEDTGASDTAQVLRTTVFGCDSSGNRILTLEQDASGANKEVTQVFQGLFDFRAYPDVVKVDIQFSCPTAVGAKGVDVRQVSAKCPFPNFAITNSSGTAIIKQGDIQVYGTSLKCAGATARATVSSSNWSAYDTLLADVQKGSDVQGDLTLRLALKVGGTYYYSQPSVVSGERTAFDISLIAASLTAVVEVGFETTQDLTINSLATGGTSEVMRVTNLRTPGNLTPSVAVSYIWTQVKASGTSYPADVLYEGSGSPFSNSIVPTATQRRATLDLKGGAGVAPTLDSATTHLALYRLGGATPGGDTRARLVALVPIGANATLPAATTQDQPSNKYFWDYTNRIFYDNTPDEDLIAAEVYQLSRDRIPTGGTALAHHAGRLWIARYDSTRRVNDVYASWLIDGLNDFPYMSEATDIDDPELDTKGVLLRLGGQGSGDRAVAFSSTNLDTQNNRGASLMILRQSAPPAIISGWTPSDFELNPAPVGIGGGLLSAEGVENVNGATVYLASTGLVSSSGANLDYASEAIERRLSLEAIGKTRYSQTFLCWHNRRLWCIVPGASSTDGEALVWDERVKGWCRVVGYSSLGFTSACSLSGGEDSGDMYIGGRDGQIYKLSGSVSSPAATTDKATPAGTARAISWILQTRSHGQKDAETEIRYAYNRVNRLFFDITSGAAGTLTWTLTNERGEVATGTFALPSGRTLKTDIREFADIRGMTHNLTFASDAAAGLTLHSYAMGIVDIAETR